jgi:site-specific recombinase XerD
MTDMKKKKKHHLMPRNGIWYFRMVINGKDRWKTTRTRDFDEAVKVRDFYLHETEKLAIEADKRKFKFLNLDRAIELRHLLKDTLDDNEKDAIVDQILDDGEDIAIKEEALAVFKGFEESNPLTRYLHDEYVKTALGHLTPLAPFKDKWLDTFQNKKTMLDYRRAFDVLTKQFQYAEDLDFQKAKTWLRKVQDQESVTPQTVKKWVSAYKNLWEFLQLEEKSPWKDQKLKANKENPRLCWKLSEVLFLLDEAKKKSNSKTWLFHLINIAAHTGARIAAIADMKDYKEDWNAIHFPAKKKEEMDRVVACHPNIKASVIWWMNKENYRPLNSKQMSRGFGNFKRGLGIKSEQLVFHSFRHTVIKYLKNIGCPVAMNAGIVGHKNKTFTTAVYGLGPMQAKATEKWIEQIDYNKEDWQEIDDRRQIDLDLEASVLEGQEGTT